MTETPLELLQESNFNKKKKGHNNEEEYTSIFPGIYRRTMARATFGAPVAVKIFRDYMHPTRVNCILCPEEWLNILQVTYKNNFARSKSFKIILTQSTLQDIQSEEEQDKIIEETHNRAHRGIQENHRMIREFYFPKMKSKVTTYVNLFHICLENKYERRPYRVKFAYTPIPKSP